MASGGLAAEEPMVFPWKTGDYEIYLLVETRGPGRSGILIGADEALQRKYLGGGFASETNTFLIKGGGKTVLVDTGFGGAVFDNLKKLGVEPSQVDAVLLTHLHGDHIGGLARDGKALFPRAKVYVAQQEKDYWTVTNVNRGAAAALAPYEGRLETFFPGELGGTLQELLPGIFPVAAFGHTPGHTLYLIRSGDEQFLIWGDLMHVQLLQFPRPDISVTYDTDPAAAGVIRTKVLDYAARNRIPIGGMHLVYPAVGTVQAEGAGFRLISP
jgi:glyoxylase-like metal-dependent hydrolase (beta-lactamase superfamily II)